MTKRSEIAEILLYDPWFRRQPETLRTAIAEEAQAVQVEAGHWIYDSGEAARGLYGVLAGSVAMHIRLETGENALVNIAGPGRIFGYAARFLEGQRIATAVAREPGTLLYLPERSLEAIAQREPDLWIRLAQLSSMHVVGGFRLAVANTWPAEARLAAHLLILAAFFGSIERLPVTQEELGELTGLSRKTVNRTLAGFEQRGLIRTGYRFLDLLDAEGLAHVRDTGRPER